MSSARVQPTKTVQRLCSDPQEVRAAVPAPPYPRHRPVLAACGGDLLTCALGYCAPMVLFGMNQVEMADGDSRRWGGMAMQAGGHGRRVHAGHACAARPPSSPHPHPPLPRFFPACCAYSCIPAGFVLSSLVAGPAVAVVAQMPPDVAVATTYGMVYACALVGQVALAGYASRQRGRMRKQEGLPPARCADFWQWCCCPACAVCQEGAQMQVSMRQRLQAAEGRMLAQPRFMPHLSWPLNNAGSEGGAHAAPALRAGGAGAAGSTAHAALMHWRLLGLGSAPAVALPE